MINALKLQSIIIRKEMVTIITFDAYNDQIGRQKTLNICFLYSSVASAYKRNMFFLCFGYDNAIK